MRQDRPPIGPGAGLLRPTVSIPLEGKVPTSSGGPDLRSPILGDGLRMTIFWKSLQFNSHAILIPEGWISTRGSPFFGARDDSQKTLPMA